MKQIAFKLPKEQLLFLEWYSKKSGTPVGSLYRQITLDSFNQWKIDHLISEYKKGSLSFKRFCDLGNINLSEGMLILEEEQIEPPIPPIVDEYTELVSNLNIEKKDKSIYKNGIRIKRKSKQIEEE